MMGEAVEVTIVPVRPGIPITTVLDEHLDDIDRSSLVVADDLIDEYLRTAGIGSRSFGELATSRLDQAGWEIPTPLVDAGEPITATGDPIPVADTWFNAFLNHHPRFQDMLGVVPEAREVVATLERLIADGIIPTAEGWVDNGLGRLQGDASAMRMRLDERQSVVSGIDTEIVQEALDCGRYELLDFAEVGLRHYLRWCRARGKVTTAQRIAYASHQEHPAPFEHVCCVVDGLPAIARLKLLTSAAISEMTLIGAVTHPARSPGAWLETDTQVIDRLDQELTHPDRLEIESEASAAGSDVTTATVWHEPVDDPVIDSLRVIDAMLTDGFGESEAVRPDDIRVITETPQQARRLIRLARNRALELARAGNVAIYRTPLAVLSIAWLRIISGHDVDRGWAVVLEQAGCSAGDLEAWLGSGDKPAVFAAMRSDLKQLDDGLAVIAAISSRYDVDDRSTAALLEHLDRTLDGWSTPLAVLSHLEAGFERGRSVTIGEAETGLIEVVTTRDPVVAFSPIIIHVGDGLTWSHGRLTYAPPLGLHLTHTTVDVEGQPVEIGHPNWQTLAVVRDHYQLPRRYAARRSVTQARDHAILLGSTDDTLDSTSLSLEDT